jgi:TRAP-type C4-dicarboxylate transport system permease small subunit
MRGKDRGSGLRIWHGLLDAFAFLAVGGILFCMAAVTLEVLSRYFYGQPLSWVLEVTEHVLLYLPFLGMAWLARDPSGHVRIDLLSNALRPRSRRILSRAVDLLTACVCLVAASLAAWTTWDHYERNLPTQGVHPIPLWVLLGIIPFGLALTAIEYARLAWARELRPDAASS